MNCTLCCYGAALLEKLFNQTYINCGLMCNALKNIFE